MSINTYDELQSITLTSATSSITFNSISQGYTDLVLVASGSAAGGALEIQVGNGSRDTTNSYSRTYMYGDGSVAPSFRNSNLDRTYNTFGLSNTGDSILHFMNYSNTSTFKTILSRGSDAATYTTATVSLWRSTNAINTIYLTGVSGGNLAAGSRFSLYGIKAWSNIEASPKATGGYVYSDTNYWYHSFPFSSSFTVTQGLSADILVIAGGGSGGNSGGAGGGGAGGVTYTSAAYLGPATYTLTVGSGGSGNGGNGGNSQFGILTASVGGGGGGFDNPASGTPGSLDNGKSGGSGGGGSIDSTARASGTSGQGNEGGLGKRGSNNILSGGGGGGAGAAGADAGNSIDTPGAGGNGISTYSSWGLATRTGENVAGTVWYAGGGAAIGWNGTGTAAGGLGGGGSYLRANGTVSSGGGGLAAYGNGGSGIIIVRYAK